MEPPSPTSDLSAAIERAFKAQAAGRLAEARDVYERILQIQPNHFDALRLLGVLWLQAGDVARSIETTTRAIAESPTSGVVYFNLANAYFADRRWEKALDGYDQAIAREPGFAAAHFHRGTALHHLARFDEAVASFDRAIALKPDYAQAYANRGAALRALKRPSDALASQDAALAIDPSAPAAHTNRGNALMDMERYDEALASFEIALSLQPQSSMAHNNLGYALLRLKRLEEAVASFARAIELDPANAEAHLNQGAVLMELRRHEAALTSFEAAIALDPQRVEAHSDRGGALAELERFEEALASFETALSLRPGDVRVLRNKANALALRGDTDAAIALWDSILESEPDHPEVQFFRGVHLLARGCFAEGWRGYEYRWLRPGFIDRSAGALVSELRARLEPANEIADFAGRHVAVVGEQGVGDTLMFASMVADLRKTAASVTLVCEHRLHRLFSNSFPGVVLLDPGTARVNVPLFEKVIAIGSLGRLYRNRVEDFPGEPYLSPRQHVLSGWAERLGPKTTRLRVGLSWRGGTPTTGAGKRSLTLTQVAPLLQLPDCEFVSLQYGADPQEIEAANADLPTPIRVFAASEIDDFEDLAGLVRNLDVIVTVQTALAHLSGAVGAPALVMVPQRAEWRYGASSPTMPWYRSVTLFRQEGDGDWAQVIARVAQRLRQMG